MPNTKSAQRAHRQQEHRRVQNLRIRSAYKSAVSQLKKQPIVENLQQVYKTLDKAAKRRVITKNKSSRLKSRLARWLGHVGAKVEMVKSASSKSTETPQ